MITNIRRFTAGKAGASIVSREDFDALDAKVDRLIAEIDELLSADTMFAAISEAVQPLLDKLHAGDGKKVTNAARSDWRHLAPRGDDESSPTGGAWPGNRRSSTAIRVDRVALAPRGD